MSTTRRTSARLRRTARGSTSTRRGRQNAAPVPVPTLSCDDTVDLTCEQDEEDSVILVSIDLTLSAEARAGRSRSRARGQCARRSRRGSRSGSRTSSGRADARQRASSPAAVSDPGSVIDLTDVSEQHSARLDLTDVSEQHSARPGSSTATETTPQNPLVLTPMVLTDSPGPGDSVCCAICLESVAYLRKHRRQLMSTTCGHVFCSVCLNESIKLVSKCPTCRKKLTKTKIHPLFI